jgi:hypothetical protein
MKARKFVAKRSLILLLSLFVYTAAWSQQNSMGFKGSRAQLMSVNLKYFADGEIPDNSIPNDKRPDKELNYLGVDYEMHQLGFPKLTFYIYQDIRFADNKLFVSTFGTDERIIDMNIEQITENAPFNKAVLSCEYTEPIEIDFAYREMSGDMRVLMIEYTISDKDNEKYKQQILERLAEGHLENENNSDEPKGAYRVTLTYLIK